MGKSISGRCGVLDRLARAALVRALLWRMLAMATVVFAAVIFTFVLARLLPGDPAAHLAVGVEATPEGLAALRRRLGLDVGIGTQLWRYLCGILTGDWGYSFSTGEPVFSALRERVPATLELTACGFLLSLAIGMPLGLAAALHPRRWPDTLCRVLTSAAGSVPSFFVALALIYVFYVHLGWAPEPVGRLDPLLTAPPVHTGFLLIDAALVGDWPGWRDAAQRLMLPALTMAIFAGAPLARIVRSAMLGALASDPVRTARSLGLPRSTVLIHYALAQALPAIVTAIGMILSFLLGANVAVEKVFAWPGIGTYALDALGAADYAPLQGFILCVAVLFAVLNLTIDVIVGMLDPRTRKGTR